MSTDSTTYACKHCDYKSKWKCNVTRHMVRKHVTGNVIPQAGNVISQAGNVIPIAGNVIPEAENVIPICVDINQCTKCKKIFSRRHNLNNHISNCKGQPNTLNCDYCNATFTQRSNKSRHLTICKAKLEADTQALVVVVEPKDTLAKTVGDTTINNTTQNANTINNNTTINNTNILVYNPNTMDFLNDHISKNDFRKLAFQHDFSQVLTDYSTALLSRPENQCIRKTNLRSTSSAIHVGDNNWEYHSDKQVLPKLLSNIAGNFNEVAEQYKSNIYKQLETFMIDVTCEAQDCHEDVEEEARMKALYKRTVLNIKHLLFNLTKQTIAEKRKKIRK